MHSSTSPMTTGPEPARSCASLPATFRAVRFFLFGFYATYIAHTFFPASSEFASLMMTFAVFGAGFLMRPIGAIVLGAYIDKVGRRKGLIVTLSIMAAGTFLIVLIPLTKASGFGRRCWCCAGACCKASRRARSWAACPFIWPRSPRQAVRLLHQLAVRQPAGGYHGGGSHGLRAQCGAGRKRHSRVGWRIPFLFGCLIVPSSSSCAASWKRRRNLPPAVTTWRCATCLKPC